MANEKNNIVMSQNPNKLYEVFLTQKFKVDIGELDTSDPRIKKYVPHFTNHCFVNDEARDPNTDELLGACVGIWVYSKDEEEAVEKAWLHIVVDIYHMYVANELSRVKQDKHGTTFLYKQLLRELEYTIK